MKISQILCITGEGLLKILCYTGERAVETKLLKFFVSLGRGLFKLSQILCFTWERAVKAFSNSFVSLRRGLLKLSQRTSHEVLFNLPRFQTLMSRPMHN